MQSEHGFFKHKKVSLKTVLGIGGIVAAFILLIFLIVFVVSMIRTTSLPSIYKVMKDWNNQDYKAVYEMICREEPRLGRSALAYYILQEMAVITSMVKSGQYNRRLAGSVQRQVRKNLREYLSIREVPFYLKICALLLSVDDRLLVFPYRIIGRRKRGG